MAFFYRNSTVLKMKVEWVSSPGIRHFRRRNIRRTEHSSNRTFVEWNIRRTERLLMVRLGCVRLVYVSFGWVKFGWVKFG